MVEAGNDKFDKLLDLVEAQTAATEKGFAELRAEVRGVNERVDGVNERVDGLRGEMKTGLDGLRSELRTELHELADVTASWYVRLEGEVRGLREDFRGLDERVDGVRSDLRWLGNHLAGKIEDVSRETKLVGERLDRFLVGAGHSLFEENQALRAQIATLKAQMQQIDVRVNELEKAS